MAEMDTAAAQSADGGALRALDHDPGMRGEGDPSEPGGHVASVGLYVGIYLALLALTATTVGVAFLNLGIFSNVVAVGIALVKGALVLLFFMHVRWSPRLIPLTAVAGLFWLIHLFGGTLSDYFSRGLLGAPGR